MHWNHIMVDTWMCSFSNKTSTWIVIAGHIFHFFHSLDLIKKSQFLFNNQRSDGRIGLRPSCIFVGGDGGGGGGGGGGCIPFYGCIVVCPLFLLFKFSSPPIFLFQHRI